MSLKNNRDKRELNPYLRQLQEIAKITEYESIASIPQQSKDFIYTINSIFLLTQNLISKCLGIGGSFEKTNIKK